MRAGNYHLSDEIRAYWAERAETFDRSFAHGIAAGREFEAWADEISRHLPPSPAEVLELACGTGEISKVILSLGHRLTGLDFTQEMLSRAISKHQGHPHARFILADAQNTMEPENRYDALVARHLTWTLTDPEAAYADWLRVLRPKGRLVLFDGDWARENRWTVMASSLIRWLGRHLPPDPVNPQMMRRHENIMAQLPYGDGLTADRLAKDLAKAGFCNICIHSHDRVTRAMGHKAPLARKIGLQRWNRFIVTAEKPSG